MTELAHDRTLTVELGERSYPIHIGVGLLNRSDSFVPYLAGSQVMIVTNETVAPHYLDTLRSSLPEHLDVPWCCQMASSTKPSSR